VRVLLIEDDKKIAGFVARGLREAGFVTDVASDGNSGLALAVAEPYDCAVVDLMLPGIDGIAVIESMRRRKVGVPVLILSAKRSVDDRIHGLQRGGDDYLTKPFAFSELLARIQALIRRANKVVEASTLTVHDLTIDLLSRTVRRGSKRVTLQPKEFALLEYLMRNAGRVVSKTMIMERVWDYSFDPQTNIVEARICRLRDKVDKGFGTRLIHTVRGLGYVLRADDEAGA
jgi:two-component system OmpR family response regulator